MCDQCEALRINGILCHEQGCPVAAWELRCECRECGTICESPEAAAECCAPCEVWPEDDATASALADAHEEACYEDEGEAAYGREE